MKLVVNGHLCHHITGRPVQRNWRYLALSTCMFNQYKQAVHTHNLHTHTSWWHA